ncbi:MAG: tetratricopeptide repeat protein [Chloroflexota bacterium]|nr:tetratricopeptide repeat protein [Chloroflexota bacterium]
MAGNRAQFEEALQQASERVWEEKWPEAVAAYQRALQEYPRDIAALQGYAWALFNANAFEEAEKIYQRLTQLAPQDPGPYERLAQIQERRGANQQAAQSHFQAADLYHAQGLLVEHISALETSVQLDPHHDQPWVELLKHYQQQSDREHAILATLWLAYLYQGKHHDWAIEVCRQMQQAAPRDRRLRQVMSLLQSGRPLPQPPSTGEFAAALEEAQQTVEVEHGEDQGTPAEVAQLRATTAMAESVFTGGLPQLQGISQDEVSLLIGQAVDAQTRGDLKAALYAYEQLTVAGVSMPSIHFNLGLLYKELMRFDEAVEQFLKSLPNSEYVLGSHFALGECYQVKGQFKEALEHFLEAVQVIDLATVKRDQADDLIRVYEGLAQSLVNSGEPERTQELVQSLVDFLGQRGWEDEILKARHRLDSLARDGVVLSLAESLSLPDPEDILCSVALAQEYVKRQKLYAALEELEYAIGKAPFYLPLHTLLANFMMESGNLEATVEKYRIIAQTYEIRGRTSLALATYRQILELSPLDIGVHKRMIELLIHRGQIDKALSQYLQVADAYYQLAQPERARDTYEEALHLAPRGSKSQKWQVRFLHRMADLDMQRLDWQAAIKDYEEITHIAPDDERAHLGLLRLYPRIGRAHSGFAALDRLLKRYLETRRGVKARVVLEELVQEDPESIPLRFRAAQIYLNTGKREKALEHLDILGDLQLEAGRKQDALKTIEAILALNPSNADAYRNLYRELGGQGLPES